ncbi:MAG: vWA domain-containing protein [Polyangiaceae bacterium]
MLEPAQANFSFLTAPWQGCPQAAAPAGFVAPTFVNNCTAVTTVLLALDRSGSMAWHRTMIEEEVCANGIDDDSDGAIDRDHQQWRTEPRIAFLRAAAGMLALANGRGQRVGIVSFNGLATLDLSIQDVNAGTVGNFNTAIDNLMPGGATAIGRALSSSAVILGETDANRTVFLISDGHNTEGETPESVVPALTAQGTRVFTISTGGASNDPTLGGIASMTRGATLDARDSRTLVNAFVRQFARSNNDGTLIPLYPYSVNRADR